MWGVKILLSKIPIIFSCFFIYFFEKVKEITGTDYSYFSEQYFYTPNQPQLEYYQTDSQFYYRWNNINDNFVMPIDLLVNGLEKRVFPSQEFQSIDTSKHATVEVMDWRFYVKKQKVSNK